MEIPGVDGDGEAGRALLTVGGRRVVMQYDAGHLAAHADDFLLSWQAVLGAIGDGLDASGMREGVIHDGFMQTATVGLTGVVAVEPGDPAFWGYRPGRTVPSHLIVGEKMPTRELCIWGEWAAPDRFDLWTCYPGSPAPREICDPEIRLDEIDQAIAFWSVHAIVVDRDGAEATRSSGQPIPGTDHPS